jgi:hypothetical protein
MANIKVLFWFDTEDYITEEDDEALLGLLNLLDIRNIKGIFKIVGEKARVLEEHNRRDILGKLSRHEVGYHTDYHSVHPTVSEFLESFGFKSGAEEFEKRERSGLEDLTRITGMLSKCYGQPGYSWAPQAFPALKKWNVPIYLDVHDQVTLNSNPFWYGGLLNFTDLKGVMRMELEEGGLDEAKERFDRLYDELSGEKVGFVSIYYHPCEFSCTEFWDGLNFGNGRNTPRNQWRPAPLRAEGEMEHYLNMLGKFLDYTLSKENVEYITSTQALSLESSNQTSLQARDVQTLAGEVGNKLNFKVYNNFSLSAAELHSVFCRYLLGQELKAEFLYGPENEVSSDSAHSFQVADIKKAVSVAYPKVFDFGQLPDYFMVANHRVNPVDLTCTMAKIIAEGLNDNDSVEIVRGTLQTKEHAKDMPLWGPKWVIFPKELKVPNIVEMSKLQTWTLKPAIF